LGDVVVKLIGGASITPNDYMDKGIRTIPKGAINSSGIADLSGSKFISKEYFDLYKHNTVSNNEIVTSLRDLVPSAPNMGRIVRIVGIQEIFLMPQGVYKIVVSSDLSEDFLITFSNSQVYRCMISAEKSGSTQVHIRNGEFLGLSIPLPSFQEQQKIGQYFQDLDNLIRLQEQKLEKVTNLKKAMLEKMFPKENADVPEIRFKGFTEKWKELPVKALCSISTGKSNTQDRKIEGVFPFYVRSATIEKSDRFLFDQEAVLTVGDGVGTGKVYHYVNGKYDLHQRVYRMFDFQGILGKYFYYIFSKEFNKRVMSMTAKTSVDSVRLEMISEMKVNLPCMDEQKVIVAYFQNLDQLIAQSQQKIEQLKHLKQALLQKMFI